MQFDFPKLKPTFTLSEQERSAYTISDRPNIVDWCQKNIRLTKGYTQPGAFVARPWQIEPLNWIHEWNNIYFLGPTQTGKSTMADMFIAYAMGVYRVNGMVAYSEGETVRTVFKIRIREMIERNPVLRDLWSGKDDDLTIDNIILEQCLWRVASAQNKNSLATFPAAVVVGSEVGKWERMPFNPIDALKARQGSYYSMGLAKTILETTPYEPEDYMYKEVFKSGTLLLRPHYPCLHCGKYQELTDAQIKLRIVDGQEPNHAPERIRQEGEKACFYECAHCKQEITEMQRIPAWERVVWAAPAIEQEDFSQQAEFIAPDGTIDRDKTKYDAICGQWTRLTDVNFKFSECLARFFESKNDPEKMKSYQNDTMARYYHKKSGQISVSYIESKKRNYFQNRKDTPIPDDVVIITAGFDSQDQGFYGAFYGWGARMTCFLLRHHYVYAPITDSSYRDKQVMFDKFQKEMFSKPFFRDGGMEVDLKLGLIDRGGHRPDDVDFIVAHDHKIQAYIGLTKTDPKKPIIYKVFLMWSAASWTAKTGFCRKTAAMITHRRL